MALDVFGREAQDPGSSFSADNSVLTFSGSAVVDAQQTNLLIQNLSANYQQTITRLFELGNNTSTFIQGRTQGTLGIARVVGPKTSTEDFIKKFSKVCTLKENLIHFNLGGAKEACPQTPQSNEGFIAQGCLIQSLAYTVESQDVVIKQQIQMQIISLNKTKEAGESLD